LWSVQTIKIKRGEGTFSLMLPMACEGWPHISFYPADGGSSFGGNFFGTGEARTEEVVGIMWLRAVGLHDEADAP